MFALKVTFFKIVNIIRADVTSPYRYRNIFGEIFPQLLHMMPSIFRWVFHRYFTG